MNDKKRRINRITVRLNDVEIEKIQRFADREELPLSEAVRRLIQKLK